MQSRTSLLVACGIVVACTGCSYGAVVAQHYAASTTRATWGYDFYIMGQSFVIGENQPVSAETFSWIGVSNMPQSDVLYLFSSQYTGSIEDLAGGSAGHMASARLIPGTSTYEFTEAPVLFPGVRYFAYMSNSLLFDRFTDGALHGPAETAMPSSFTGWNPTLPPNWFDSYPQGQAYSYVLDHFVSLTDQATRQPRYEYDFFFEVTGDVVPEPQTLSFLAASLTLIGRRRRIQMPNKSWDATGDKPAS